MHLKKELYTCPFYREMDFIPLFLPSASKNLKISYAFHIIVAMIFVIDGFQKQSLHITLNLDLKISIQKIYIKSRKNTML